MYPQGAALLVMIHMATKDPKLAKIVKRIHDDKPLPRCQTPKRCPRGGALR